LRIKEQETLLKLHEHDDDDEMSLKYKICKNLTIYWQKFKEFGMAFAGLIWRRIGASDGRLYIQ